MSTTEDQIKEMYEAQLNTQKSQLQSDYDSALAQLDEAKKTQEQTLAKNLNLTKTESAKASVGNEEYYAASGLSSGGRSQARLAQENQLQADLTALRAAQQQANANIEQQRALLAKEFSNAITEAQAANDLEKAQALYELAKEEEAKLLAKQEAAAGLMAQTGDYSRYGDLYGLTPGEIAKLTDMYGGSGGGGGSYSSETVKIQEELNAAGFNVTVDGIWGDETQKAYELYMATGGDPVGALRQDLFPSGTNSKPLLGNEGYQEVATTLSRLQASGVPKSELRDVLDSALQGNTLGNDAYFRLMALYGLA